MKKILLFAFVTVFSISSTFAQLPDGSVAPNFDLTDLNGTPHNLYALLDQGYTVFLDFSAVWCPPCWSYHTGGTLEDLYENHGPAGYPGVSPNTSDDVMVFMIEGDENTVANLGGSGGNTQGDWITGTLYPIICTDGTVNNDDVTSDYQIGYWPTIYMVCPDRLTTEVGQSSNPYGAVSACPPPASNDNDARTFPYSGATLTCGDLTPEIMIQNYGIVPLTSVTIDVAVNGVSVSSTPWSGNLTTYATYNVTLPVLTGLTNNDAVTITVSMPNGMTDADPSNNPAVSFNVQMVQTTNVNVDVTVNITTDQYASETTWDIVSSTGQTVASGGPYSTGNAPQTPVTTTLNTNECYFFTIYDSYGDGICCTYGNGSFTVTDGWGTVISSGGTFLTEDGEAFQTGSGGGPPNSWDCISPGNCQDPGTGQGQYSTQTACLAACVATYIPENISNLSVYPSPVKDILTIKGDYIAVDIFDIFGKLVLSSEYAKNINVSSLADGIYMINITTEEGIQNQKITITK